MKNTANNQLKVIGKCCENGVQIKRNLEQDDLDLKKRLIVLEEDQKRLISTIDHLKRTQKSITLSRDFYKKVFSRLKDVFVIINLDGQIQYVSSEIYTLAGYEPQDIVGSHIKKYFVNNEEYQYSMKILEALLIAKKSIQPIELALKTKQLTTVNVEVRGYVVKKDDKAQSIELMIRNINRRKEAEFQLKSTEEKYREFFDNITDFAYIHDLKGNFIHANKALRQLIDYYGTELGNIHLKRITSKSYHTDIDSYIETLQHQGKAAGIARIAMPGEPIRYVYYNSILIRNRQQPPVVRGFARDITKRILAKQKIRKRENYFQTAFNNSGVCIFILEPDFLITSINLKVVDLLSFPKDEIEGKVNLFSLFSDEYKKEYLKKKTFQEWIAQKQNFEFETKLVDRHGHEHSMAFIAQEISDTGQWVATAFEIPEHKNHKEKQDLENEGKYIKSTHNENNRFGKIIGRSHAMQKVYKLITKASSQDNHVIIYGESGTGKELVAKAIHDQSARRDKAFMTVNCGAIPENLVESEFFGYQKGAFTGALKDKKGYFAEADGGTLFLDEIGEISMNMQVKLLRVIDGGGYTPVGKSQTVYSDVRIIGATNQNLWALIRKGKIREDFYYRIHILPIHLPPLRQRLDDLPLLIEHFLNSYGKPDIKDIPIEVLNRLNNHQWPGNIRELQNVLFQYLTLGAVEFSTHNNRLHHAFESIASRPSDGYDQYDLRSMIAEFEKKILSERLSANSWNKSKTAKELGLDRKTLLKKINCYGLSK